MYVGGPFSGDESKKITRAIKANVTLQHRTAYNEWLLVADIHHDMIIGRLWFEHHDVGIDCHRRRLLFDDFWSKDSDWIQNIHVEYRNTKLELLHQADAERREVLMEKDDKRRRDGAAVKRRIQQLEASGQRDTPASASWQHSNTDIAATEPRQV